MHAGDGHLPGRARAVNHADAADVSGRGPVGRPRYRAQPLLAWSGCPACGVTVPAGDAAGAEGVACCWRGTVPPAGFQRDFPEPLALPSLPEAGRLLDAQPDQIRALHTPPLLTIVP